VTGFAHIEGKYEILERIKEGGMGAIYKVRHRLLDEIRVIKVMRPQLEDDPELKDRFLNEARIVIRLRHPNIAQLYDFSLDDDGNAFIVMEFIDGITIEELLGRIGPPSPGFSLEVLRQSLAAIGYLHRKGIVHRDIAPDNLMLTKGEEGTFQVKLIDMGIAKVLKGASLQTQAGVFVGKLRYASPEQLSGSDGAPVDARSDIYSLGVVMYELLTGKGPFPAGTVPALVAAHFYNQPTPFEETDPGKRIPAKLRAIVLKALAKKPEERFQSADEMLQAMTALQKNLSWKAEEIERAFHMPDSPTDRIQIAARGSSQARLDRQFASEKATGGARTVESTAVLTASAPPTGKSTASRRRRDSTTKASKLDPALAAQIRAFLTGAEKLIDLGQMDDAKMQLGAVLELDPGNTQAGRLMSRIESSVISGPDAAAIVEAINSAVELAEAALARGDIAAARTVIERAQSELGVTTAFEDVRAKLGKLEDKQRREDAIGRAAALVRATQFEEAIAILNRVQDEAGSDVKVAGLLEQARTARREHEEERTRQEAVAKVVAEVEQVLATGAFDEAKRRLAKAEQTLGAASGLDGLDRRIRQAEEKRLEADILALLTDARKLADAKRFDEALDTLEHALALRPEDEGIRRVLQSTQKAKDKHERAKERERGATEAAAQIDLLLDAGDLSRAEQALETALHEYGEHEILSGVHIKLETLLRRAREKEVKALLRKATAHVEENRFPEAIECLEKAGELAPEDGTIRSILVKTRQAHREYQAELQRATAVAAAVKDVRGYLHAGRIDMAEAKIHDTVTRWGESSELRPFTERIATLRQREREARVKLLLREATACIEEFAFAEGITKVEEALLLDPDDPALAEIMSKMKTAQREHEAEQRRAKAAADAAAGVEKLIAEGRLERAEQRLSSAIQQLGETGPLLEAQSHLHEVMAARREAEERIEEAVGSARTLMALQDFDRAIEVLRRAGEDHEEVRTLLDEAEAARAKLQVERRRGQEIAEATSVIEAQIKAGDLEEASRTLTLAEKLYGNEPVIKSLRRRVEQLLAKSRQSRVGALIEEARTLAEAASFEKAIAVLQQAHHLDPSNQETSDLLWELPRRQAQHTIERYLAQGNLVEASRALALAEKLYGATDPILDPLRRKVEGLRASGKISS
jgi:serine/threonine protein kinase